jgi:hypothetical protein
VELHPSLAELATLLGTWQGEGEGGYPTVESFRYRETAIFEHAGKPRMSYRNATEDMATGLPLHAESGFLRGAGPGRAEFVLAYGSGIADVEEGDVTPQPDGVALHLRTTGLVRTGTAKEVLTVERRITVVGDTLRYQLAMGAVRQPVQHHLAAVLTRTGGAGA